MGFSFGFSFGTGGFACANTICQVASTFLYIINFILVPLLFAVAFIVFLWGVFRAYIWSGGDPGEVTKGHQLILWGIIGFVVMISLWGLVNVVANTFGLTGYVAPPLPLSY
jgi:Ni,Fe-hydrogenase I cytochrome b subunit